MKSLVLNQDLLLFFCFERPSHYTLNVQHNVLHVSLRIVVKLYPEK